MGAFEHTIFVECYTHIQDKNTIIYAAMPSYAFEHSCVRIRLQMIYTKSATAAPAAEYTIIEIDCEIRCVTLISVCVIVQIKSNTYCIRFKFLLLPNIFKQMLPSHGYGFQNNNNNM